MELKGVLMLSDSFFPVNGGREVVIDNLMRCYNGKVNALLGAPVFKKHKAFNDSSLPYKVVRCNSISFTKNEVLSRPNKAFKKQIEQEIKDGNIQLIHVQTKYGLMKYAMRLRKKYNIPVVASVHTNYPLVYKKTLKCPLVCKLALGRISKILNKVDMVVTVSKFMKKQLVLMGVKNKIQIISNGNKFANSRVDYGQIQYFYNKYNININNDNVLIYVGRMSQEKSVDVILKSLQYVKNPLKMVFIGGGNEKLYSCLAKEYNVAEKCQFLGQIDNMEEQAALCAGARLQVFPSVVESFGLTIAECGALGTPSVVTAGMATAEFVNDRENGFLIDGSAEDLAKKIDEVLGDSELLNMVSENAKKTFNLSWDEVADEYINAYNEVLNKFSKK